jgi:hypothetical protein
MERELWLSLYAVMKRLDKSWGRWKYSTSDILAVYFWGVVHERSTSWSVRAAHWSDDLLPAVLPDQSTMSRRLRGDDVLQLLCEVEDHWTALFAVAFYWVRSIDAKPLVVGGGTQDADASYGRAARGFARGYKFYAVWGGGPLPIAWALAPMNVSEKTMARRLIPTLPGGGYLLGDAEYDANDLYDLAAAAGYQLVAPKRKAKKKTGTGLGHRPQSPHRLRSIEIRKGRFGRRLYGRRRQIERDFGNATSFGGGLAPLPAWVRRFPRVRNWVHAKLLINAARWIRNQPPALA